MGSMIYHIFFFFRLAPNPVTEKTVLPPVRRGRPRVDTVCSSQPNISSNFVTHGEPHSFRICVFAGSTILVSKNADRSVAHSTFRAKRTASANEAIEHAICPNFAKFSHWSAPKNEWAAKQQASNEMPRARIRLCLRDLQPQCEHILQVDEEQRHRNNKKTAHAESNVKRGPSLNCELCTTT